TEHTLNRFLPTVITQRVLKEMGVNLADVRDKLTNLNAQEIGNDAERAKQWERSTARSPRVPNPVFDEEEVNRMVRDGVTRLTNMQLSDGGWGWFSGHGEWSSPHTTAVVVRGLIVARGNDVAIVPGTIERGLQWLNTYQATQVQRLKNAATNTDPWKESADNLDALIYHILALEGQDNHEMREFIYRDRQKLSSYGLALFGLAL